MEETAQGVTDGACASSASRKRQSDVQRRPGRDDDDDATYETFTTTPQLATREEMAKRRILRVVRPVPETAPDTAASSSPVPGGFFKFLATPQSTSGATTVEKPLTPSFGGAPATQPTTASTESTSLFGAGAFSFGNAVSSFVEARKRMDQERAEQSAQSKDEPVQEDTPAEHEEKGETGFGSQSAIVPATGEVLAVAPCKLFAFAKDGDAQGKWTERGMGEAKIKRQGVVVEGAAADASAAVHRLLVRDGYSLNATIGKNLFLLRKVEAKHIIFIAAGPSGPTTYMLRFTGPDAEASTRLFADTLQKLVADVPAEAK